jgi:hypothetical protein
LRSARKADEVDDGEASRRNRSSSTWERIAPTKEQNSEALIRGGTAGTHTVLPRPGGSFRGRS